MKRTKRLLTLCLALCLGLGFTACGAKDTTTDTANAAIGKDITFILEWSPNTNHTGLYVAQSLGYYKDAGITLHIVTPSENGAAPLVASGKAQFGVDVQEGLGTELTLDNPLPITAVAAIIDHNTSGLISMKSKGIDAFSKLEGTTYASWDAPTELAVMKQAMTDAGCDFNKLITVPAPATDAVSLIQTGDIDTVWVYEGWDVISAQLSKVDHNFIKFSDQTNVLDYYTPLIIANNDYLETYPEDAKAFLAATAKGYEYAIDHPKEAAEILVGAVPELDLDLVTASQNYLADQYRAEKAQWGTFDKDRWTAFYDWMYQEKLIPKKLGSKGYTNDYLPTK